jgi:DNA repair photolyase
MSSDHSSGNPPSVRKGRGAVSNLQGRYVKQAREVFDDGWTAEVDEQGSDAVLPRLVTQVTREQARSILTRNASPDIPFNVSLNPYRGCEHGCIYCFARPTHSYLDLSPGLDFETRLFAKVNAVERLIQTLAKPSYQCEPIALGVNTDAYQPIEREERLTRDILQVLHDCDHPVALITKSALIERDVDLLAPMAQKGLAVAAVTLTTLDGPLARLLEPRAAAPSRRLRVIRTLTQAGIPVGISVAPVIPFLTDDHLEKILEAAREAGAVFANFTVLRLPWEVAPLFREWLETHYPERANRILKRIQEMRGGQDYDAAFGARMRGQGIWADLLQQRFIKTADRLGYRYNRFELDTTQFRLPTVQPPSRPPNPQGSLF